MQVVASLSQVPRVERQRLFNLITRHGGIVRPALTSACTHLVCGSLSGAKVRHALCVPGIHIVPTSWVTSSVRKGLRENEALHRPQVAIEATSEFPNKMVLKGYSSQIFQHKVFLVDDGPAAVDRPWWRVLPFFW